ncbi:MAG: hypothetical protein RPS47_04690 [Colwellia sp.]|jgi:hypothetical protein
MNESETFTLEDGRPIDRKLLISTLNSINEIGVQGLHLTEFFNIFSATQDECQVALGISSNVWVKNAQHIGIIKDVGLAMLVRHFLLHPEEWPIKYLGTPDLQFLKHKYKELAVPENEAIIGILVGRAQHTVYRWNKNSEGAGKQHIKILLLWLEKIGKMTNSKLPSDQAKGSLLFDEYLEGIKSEAKIRDIDFMKAPSWEPKKGGESTK